MVAQSPRLKTFLPQWAASSQGQVGGGRRQEKQERGCLWRPGELSQSKATLHLTSGAAVMSASNWRHRLPPVLRQWPSRSSSFQHILSSPPGSLPAQRAWLHAFPGLAVPTPRYVGAGILSPCSEVSLGNQRLCFPGGSADSMVQQVCRGEQGTGSMLSDSRWGHASRTLGYKHLSSRGTTALSFGLCQNRLEGLPYRLLSDPSPHPVSDPVGLGCRTESSISHLFPGDAELPVQVHPGEALPQAPPGP